MTHESTKIDEDTIERIEEAFDLVEACARADGKPWLVETLRGVRKRMITGTPGDGRKRRDKR